MGLGIDPAAEFLRAWILAGVFGGVLCAVSDALTAWIGMGREMVTIGRVTDSASWEEEARARARGVGFLVGSGVSWEGA